MIRPSMLMKFAHRMRQWLTSSLRHVARQGAAEQVGWNQKAPNYRTFRKAYYHEVFDHFNEKERMPIADPQLTAKITSS